jgi:hypothetical protein
MPANDAVSKEINPWLIAIAVMPSTFIEMLDTTVVNVTLPVPTKPIPDFFQRHSRGARWGIAALVAGHSAGIISSGEPRSSRGFPGCRALWLRLCWGPWPAPYAKSQERQSGHGTLKFGRRRSKLRLYRGRLINVQTLLATSPLWRISPWLLPDP